MVPVIGKPPDTGVRTMPTNSRRDGKNDADEVPEAEAPVTAGAGRCSPDLRATGRAFVVQVTSERVEGDGAFAGRVQHLATADGGNFATAEGLVEIMRRVLRRADGREGS